MSGTLTTDPAPPGGGTLSTAPVGSTGWSLTTVAPPVFGAREGRIICNYPRGHNVPKLYAGQNFDFWDKAFESNYSEEARHGEGLRVSRPMIGPWSQYRDFRNWALGSCGAVSDGAGGGLIQRDIPAQHPKETGCWCVAVNLVKGIGAAILDPQAPVLDNNGQALLTGLVDASGNPILDPLTDQPYPATGPYNQPFLFFAEKRGDVFYDGQCEVMVTYNTLPYEIRTDAETYAHPLLEMSRYVERAETYAVQAQNIPSTIPATFTSGPFSGKIVPGNPFLLLPTKTLSYRWVDVPAVPEDAINTCVGCVNLYSFDGAGYTTYPPGTLLCQAPVKTRKQTALGAIVYEIVYRFDYRSTGWNNFLASDRKFYPANFSGLPLYPSADLSTLFRIPAPVNYYA